MMDDDGEGEEPSEINLDRELENIVAGSHRKSYSALGSSKPNVFAYLPTGFPELIAARVGQLKYNECGLIFGWVVGREWEFLQESSKRFHYENFDYLRHSHDGCTECAAKDRSIDNLEYAQDKEKFGVAGLRERLDIYLESRMPLDAEGRVPFFLRYDSVRKTEVDRFMRLAAPEFMTLMGLDVVYRKAIYVAIGKEDQTQYRDDQTEEEQAQMPKVMVYHALAAVHQNMSEVLAHTPHVSYGKFNAEKKAFVFEKNGEA